MKETLMNFGEVLENVSLKNYNTFQIGGMASFIIFPKTVCDVQNLIYFLKEKNIKYFVLGNGSNVIFSDQLFDGVIVNLKKMDAIIYQGTQVICESGVMMPRLAMDVISHGLKGFEWAAGIPGTVGGCVYGNAEAYKESTFDFLLEVQVLTPEGDLKILKKADLSYGYRTSFFKENPGYVLLSATFSLEYGDKEESMEKILCRKEKRMETQPLDYPSAGSVFRNPSSDNPSGKIIESIGMKGYIIGGAEVSKKHANFIVNTGNATSNDVRNLVELVHQRVQKETNIDLVMEQEFVGWD